MTGRLLIIGTPIGNLGDISARALEGLKSTDVIYCEDTRVTGKLCQHFAIQTKRWAYHEHNAEKVRPQILEQLAQGQTLALVSDAGMPLISDPGFKLIEAVIEAGVEPEVIPGPTAVTSALVLAGLPTDRFFFVGFLSQKQGARRASLEVLKAIPATLVFYEGPPRLANFLTDAAEILGDRKAAVSREITKLYEQTKRGSLSELAALYHEQGAPKGEIVVTIAPPSAPEPVGEEELDQRLAEALATMSLKNAVEQVTIITGLKKKLVYARALELKNSEEA